MTTNGAVFALPARQDGLSTCAQAVEWGLPLRTLRGWVLEPFSR